MKDKLTALAIFVLLLTFAGCTRANKVADMSHQLAAKQTDTIVYDLYNISRQLTIDKYAAQARSASINSDADMAASAVTGAIAEYDKITWLAREEYRKSREVNNLARFYILSQRGWYEVLYEQWKEASAEADARQAALDALANTSTDTNE